jgi:hypothetical protein
MGQHDNTPRRESKVQAKICALKNRIPDQPNSKSRNCTLIRIYFSDHATIEQVRCLLDIRVDLRLLSMTSVCFRLAIACLTIKRHRLIALSSFD